MNVIADQVTAGKRKAYVLDRFHLLRLRRIIEQRTGLYFPDSRSKEMELAYTAAFNEMPELDADVFWERVTGTGEGSEEVFQRLVSHLTVKETHFFRNPLDFEVLRERILPELINNRQRSTRQLRIWSAGCATGEEAYSLAITVAEMIGDLKSWDILILGTDIDVAALAKAREGVFTKWSFRGVTEDVQARYFRKKSENRYELRQEYRSMVDFRQLNIVEDVFPSLSTNIVSMDLILCRNVLIYFQPQTIVNVSNRFYDTLAEDGYLIVGHAEHGSEFHPRFKQVPVGDTFVYRKSGQPNIFTTFRPKSLYPFDDEQVQSLDPFEGGSPASSTLGKSSSRPSEKPILQEDSGLLASAKKAYNNCEYGLSVRTLQKHLLTNPNDREAILLLARNEANQGNQETARSHCERAIGLNPLDAECHYLLAILNIAGGRLDEAVANLRRSIYLDGSSIAAYFELGNCLKALNKRTPAKRALLAAANLLGNASDSADVPWADGMLAGQIRRAIVRDLDVLG